MELQMRISERKPGIELPGGLREYGGFAAPLDD